MEKIAYITSGTRVNSTLLLAALLDLELQEAEIQTAIDQYHFSIPLQVQEKPGHDGNLRSKTLQFSFPRHAEPPQIPLAAVIEKVSQQADDSPVLEILSTLIETGAQVHQTPTAQFIQHNSLPFQTLAEMIGFTHGLRSLGIEKLFCGALPLPVSAPANHPAAWYESAALSLEILRQNQCLVTPADQGTSGTTPPAAALLAHLAVFERPIFRIQSVGTGMQEQPPKGALQILVGERQVPAKPGNILIETNIDDMSPQILADVTIRLMEAGALDVYRIPIQMKKNRAGTRLAVVARPQDEERLAEMILRETSTIGLQTRPIEHKYRAKIEVKEFKTPYGIVPVKLKYSQGQVIQASPEYEACAALARQHQIPTLQVYQAALAACNPWAEDTETGLQA